MMAARTTMPAQLTELASSTRSFEIGMKWKAMATSASVKDCGIILLALRDNRVFKWGTHHSEDGYKKNLASAHSVDDDQVDNAEDEVGGTDYNGDCRGIIETDEGEQCRGIIHESVEATKLWDYQLSAFGSSKE